MLMLLGCGKIVGRFWPAMALFARVEISPKPGARKDVPQDPRTVRPASSEMFQLKATFGLLVPPTSLYWSWRHEPSRSSFLIPGSALASPKIGTFTCVNTAQTWRWSTSVSRGTTRDGAPVLSKVLKLKALLV